MAKKIQSKKNIKNLEQAFKDEKFGIRQGIAQKIITEAVPQFELAPSETIYEGKNNSFIILGRDRPTNLYSGYGGKGATQAGRIDLIVGLGSSLNNGEPPNKDTLLSPNFAIDAARIYLSQKTDLDKYMGLADVPNQAPEGRSGIGIKADTIRIHSRNDIKIVTGRARIAGFGKDGEKLSTGGKNETPGTISFIAGNYTEEEKHISFNIFDPTKRLRETRRKLQPITKGDNLVDCLTDILDAIHELSSIVGSNISLIQKMDLALATHTHAVVPLPTPPFIPVAIAPSTYTPISGLVQATTTKTILNRQVFNKKIGTLKTNYLNEEVGNVYINSKHVFTT